MYCWRHAYLCDHNTGYRITIQILHPSLLGRWSLHWVFIIDSTPTFMVLSVCKFGRFTLGTCRYWIYEALDDGMMRPKHVVNEFINVVICNSFVRSLCVYMCICVCICICIWGTAVAQWLRCCVTNRKVAGSIPDGVFGIFRWHNPSDRTMALGSTHPLTEMSTRRISWG